MIKVMSTEERERNNKIKAKLSGLGIDPSWFNEVKSCMEENGYGINQIATKVLPHIQEQIKLTKQREALKEKEIRRKEHDRKEQFELIKPKYLEFRNKAFCDILIKINAHELNLENCREISKLLIDKKFILYYKAGVKKYAIKIVILTGIVYGTIYYVFDSVKKASDFQQNIIVAVICFILFLPRAFKISNTPVVLETRDIFSGTIFSEQDIDLSILEYNKKFLKLIEYSLEENRSSFDKTLEEIYILEPSSPPPLPKEVNPTKLTNLDHDDCENINIIGALKSSHNTKHVIAHVYAQTPAMLESEGKQSYLSADSELIITKGVEHLPPPITPARAPNKIVTGVCGILLGFLGVHKFILGYSRAGLIMLLVSVLSCGIMAPIFGIIGLIEGILYLVKSDDEFVRIYVVGRKDWF